jgi:DMSO/TMAO reductase YedYZ molybdopterin-dependent catalytic subunit
MTVEANGREVAVHRVHVAFTAGLVLCALLALGGCADSASRSPSELAPSEVLEYQGERLDSIDDFRENSIKGPQQVDMTSYRMGVTGEVSSPLLLTYDEVVNRNTFQKLVRLNCVEGWSVDILWEGVLIRDLLEQAGYAPDAKVVIFRCADGYSTSLPLDYVLEREILLAYKMNDVALPEERGYPFQVVAEDKLGYKWAKWVTEIEVSDDASFEGYWEQRGYDNDADVRPTE